MRRVGPLGCADRRFIIVRMSEVPLFNAGQLEEICRQLGEVMTGGQLPHLLADAGVPAPSPQSTKWRRLVEDIGAQQRRDGNGRCVLRVIESAMAPVRFTSEPARFQERRAALNRVLSLTGFELGADGRLVGVEAEVRAVIQAVPAVLPPLGEIPDSPPIVALPVALGDLVKSICVAPTAPPFFYEAVVAIARSAGLGSCVHRSSLDEDPLF